MSQLAQDAFGHGQDFGFLSQIGGNRYRPDVVTCGDLRRRLPAGFIVKIQNGDVRSQLGKGLRESEADVTRTSGDKSNSSPKIQHLSNRSHGLILG